MIHQTFGQQMVTSNQEQLMHLEKTGAKVIVAKDAPSISTRYGWKKIEGTEVYYYLL